MRVTDSQRLDVNRSIWIRSGLTDRQYIFRSMRDTLVQRGNTVLTLTGPGDAEGLERIRKTVWNSDAHVILDGIMPHELKALRPIFEQRKNFSMALVDWWTSNYWFTNNASFLIFHNYNGIAVRRGLASFVGRRTPPLVSGPPSRAPYAIARSLAHVPALALAPFVQWWKWRQRQLENIAPERLLYAPFTIAEEHVPLQPKPPEYDFSNVSTTGGYWIMRDPYAPAWLTFADLYYDRLRLTKLIRRFPGYKVFDLRQRPGNYIRGWDEYCKVVRGSRFAIATGGLHQASVAKYTEFACLGVPMLGECLPYEFPWLEKCLFQVDTLNVTQEQLAPLLQEALKQQAVLRDNCLALRDTILKLYNAHQVLDMLQGQAEGKPIPPGYLIQ